jgi:sec-independent protein translocase protein TatA
MELVLIGLVVVLVFGAGRISEMGKGLGEGIRNFKKGLRDDEDPPQVPGRSDEKQRYASGAHGPADEAAGK